MGLVKNHKDKWKSLLEEGLLLGDADKLLFL